MDVKIQRTGNPDIDWNMQNVQKAFRDIDTQAKPTLPRVHSAYALRPTDTFVFANAAGGGFVIVLPTDGSCVSATIRKVDTSANVVTLQPQTGKFNGTDGNFQLRSGAVVIGFDRETRTWYSV